LKCFNDFIEHATTEVGIRNEHGSHITVNPPRDGEGATVVAVKADMKREDEWIGTASTGPELLTVVSAAIEKLGWEEDDVERIAGLCEDANPDRDEA